MRISRAIKYAMQSKSDDNLSELTTVIGGRRKAQLEMLSRIAFDDPFDNVTLCMG